MKKLYINTHDYQGGSWAVGQVDTLKGWRELATCWADSDNMEGTYSNLKYYRISNDELVDFINSQWDIKIEEFDESNKEHLELKEGRERY